MATANQPRRRRRAAPFIVPALVLVLGVAGLALTLRPAPTTAALQDTADVTRTTVTSPATTAGASIGPLFVDGPAAPHTCTASVVDSPAGNVVVTAAHCLSGSGAGAAFVPGYTGGSAPDGTWIVQAAYVDPSWISSQNPQADYAFLVVSPAPSNSTRASVQSAVGAAALGVGPADGQEVTVTGYAEGAGDSALVCSAQTSTTEGYPTFACGSFPGGTSGSPWLTSGADPELVGVIGGLHQGGCTNAFSYTSPFTPATRTVLHRAEDHQSADLLPDHGDDGC